MSEPFRIGYVGLGNMGTHMCNNLGRYASQNQLSPLTIWNRSTDKYASVSEDCKGAHLAHQVSEVPEKSNIIFTCLLNDAAALDVYGQMLKVVKAKTIFVDQSSLNPKTSRKLREDAEKVGATYLSCPVFGPPAVAKAAQLVLVVSGAEEGRDRVKPLLVPAVGKSIIDVGEDVGKGASLKLLGNTCILGTIELLSEAYALADSIDFDPAVFQNFIQQWFPAPAWKNYGTKISKGTFSGTNGFRIDGGLKDANHILSLGQDMGHPCPVPTIERAVKNLNRAKEIGGPGMDWSSLAIAQRESVGLEPFRPGSDQGK
ncbi:NAD binding domain of 6-phosphogluconate dehydrogenase-domain-containing protein [Naematelia encephala]|uniref:NAD binding domain of 6-phosphogluconate dehydrogenase-domain-containing protein n=1 Tax=Naematelia encephala TaxID=71784 RepID=A0A1Y2AWM1_9TREE|nr:NAD binding domain of 6-phosphogluconate dehydrogenase-domain-containing protein [Naematelia encephala]